MQGYCVGTILGYDGNKTTYLITTIFRLSLKSLLSYLVKLKI